MNYVYANSEPKKVEYHKLSDGRAFVLLHKDIEQVDVPYQMGGETVTQKMWRCHEKQFMTDLTEEQVNKQFDMLYLTADIPSPTVEERLTTVSDMLNDLSERVDSLEGSAE